LCLRNRKHGRSQIREFSPTRSLEVIGAKNKGKKNKKQWEFVKEQQMRKEANKSIAFEIE
jgi:hypothetical protein